MTNAIKAVFFDLDGTLRIPTPGPTAAFVQFARSLDIEISPMVEKRVKIWAHHYWGQEKMVKEDMKRFDTDGFWINYSKRLLETVNATNDLMRRARVIREWFDQKYQPEIKLEIDCLPTLAHLKESGFLLGVISNRPSPLDDELELLGLAGIFDIFLAAGEIGFWKPSPEIFQYVLNQFAELEAEDCYYVGDNFYADYLGAQGAGLNPILYDPEDLYDNSTYRRIRKLGELCTLLGNGNSNGRTP